MPGFQQEILITFSSIQNIKLWLAAGSWRLFWRSDDDDDDIK